MAIAAFVVGSLALGVSLATFIFNWVARSERAAESVSARLKFGPDTLNRHGIGEVECFLVVQNSGALPIHYVAASAYLPSRGIRFVSTCDALPAGAAAHGKITSVEGCDFVGAGSRYSVELEFCDGKGRKWRRSKSGKLHRVRPRELRRRERTAQKIDVYCPAEDIRWRGAWYQAELQEDGTTLMIGRDLEGRQVEFSQLAEI